MSDQPRRRFLHLSGVTVATVLAGCGGSSSNGGGDGGTSQVETVPSQYETATSQGGMERNPDNLVSKSDVSYQTEPNGDQQCSGCQYFIKDKNGDGKGACAIVEGTINPNGWCSNYSPLQG